MKKITESEFLFLSNLNKSIDESLAQYLNTKFETDRLEKIKQELISESERLFNKITEEQVEKNNFLQGIQKKYEAVELNELTGEIN